MNYSQRNGVKHEERKVNVFHSYSYQRQELWENNTYKMKNLVLLYIDYLVEQDNIASLIALLFR